MEAILTKGGASPLKRLWEKIKKEEPHLWQTLYHMNQIQARKHLVETYQKTGSISATSRLWHTSRNVVRKWVKRYEAEGEEGLKDRSRRPYNSPRQTPKEIEELVLKARKETGLGRKRLAIYLQRKGIEIPLTPFATYYAVMGLKGNANAEKVFIPPFGPGKLKSPYPSSK